MKIDESVQLLRSFIDLSRFSPKMKMRVRPIPMVFSNDSFVCCFLQGKWLTNVYQMMCMHFYKENRFPRTTKSRKRSANSWKFSFFFSSPLSISLGKCTQCKFSLRVYVCAILASALQFMWTLLELFWIVAVRVLVNCDIGHARSKHPMKNWWTDITTTKSSSNALKSSMYEQQPMRDRFVVSVILMCVGVWCAFSSKAF